MTAIEMTETRFGRVLLHIACCIKRDKRVKWHWQGIVRELRYK